jgi:flotillin
MATEILTGQLRLTVASLTIEEINQNRERFLEVIRDNIQPELQKIGLSLINVNITDITDESGYIESIGKKAASTALNQAKIDVAQQEKLGEVGKAQADRDRRMQVAQLNAEAVEGENVAAAKIASFNADLAEKNAEAQRRSEIAAQIADAKIQEERANAEKARLLADEVVPREIAKRKLEIDSAARAAQMKIEAEGRSSQLQIDSSARAAQMKIEAEGRAAQMEIEAGGKSAQMKIEAEGRAEQLRAEAAGQADAIISVQSAEAEGQYKVLVSKARGYQDLVKSCTTAQDATTILLVEKMEDLVRSYQKHQD